MADELVSAPVRGERQNAARSSSTSGPKDDMATAGSLVALAAAWEAEAAVIRAIIQRENSTQKKRMSAANRYATEATGAIAGCYESCAARLRAEVERIDALTAEWRLTVTEIRSPIARDRIKMFVEQIEDAVHYGA